MQLHKLRRPCAVRVDEDIRRIILTGSPLACQSIQCRLSLRETSAAVTALDPLQCAHQTVRIRDIHRQDPCPRGICRHHRKTGVLRCAHMIARLPHRLLKTALSRGAHMLHARTGIDQQYLPPAAPVFLDKGRHQRNHQQSDDQDLQIHKNIMHKLLKKSPGLFVFQQPFPQEVGGDQIVCPLWLQQI